MSYTTRMKKTTKKKSKSKNRRESQKKRGIDIVKVTKDLVIQKTNEFRMFFVWRSLPAIMRGISEAQLRARGISDEEVIKIASIKTKTQFAQEYDLDPHTLSNWEKKIEETDIDRKNQEWGVDLVRNVLMVVYNEVVESKNMGAASLFLNYFKKPKEPWDDDAEDVPVIHNQQFIQNIIQLNSNYQKDLRKVYDKENPNEPKEIGLPSPK